MSPKVSICIPSYKSIEHLKKALKSCFDQNFHDFEIIVSDDSPANFLKDVTDVYLKNHKFKYFHNSTPLGPPGNWNHAISKATGLYVKILHHDDWFANSDSLSRFVDLLDQNPQADFAFGGSLNCDSKGNPNRLHAASAEQVRQLSINPSYLILGNFVGAPSATIYRRAQKSEFDIALKWLVDIEFYIRFLKLNKMFAYTQDALVCITTGSAEQVTAVSEKNKMVEISEQVYVYNKFSKLYPQDRHFLSRLWFLCRLYDIDCKEKLVECGVPAESIGEELALFLNFVKINLKILNALSYLRHLLSPAVWINKILKEITVSIVLKK